MIAASDDLRADAEWQSAGRGFSYAVVRTDAGFRQLATVAGTSYSIAGLQPGETLCIAIAAVAADRVGPLSAPVCATALDVPRPPEKVQAEGIASGLLISWTAAIDGPPIVGWHVVVSEKEWSLPADAASMSATGLTDGAQYEVSVHARNAAGRSAPAKVTAVAGSRDPPRPQRWIASDRLPILLPAAAVVAHGRLWVVGYESNANTLTPATAVAALDAEGIPRNWQVLAQKPPYAPVYAGSATGDAALLLGIGGNCCGVGAAGSGEVRISRLHADGSAEAWALAGDQFQPRATAAGVAVDRMHLYVMGGFWWSGGSFTGYATDLVHVHIADLTDDGKIARWRAGAPLPRASRATATSLNGRIYALVSENSVVYAEPAADGSIGSWRTASAGGGFGRAVTSAAGRLYVGDTEGRIFVGTVTPEGDISSWSHWPAESLGEEARVLVGWEGRLYLLGRDSVLVATIDARTGHTLGEAPAVPAQLPIVRATSPSGGVVHVSWDPVRDATVYEVSRSGADPVRVTGTETTFSDLDPYSRLTFSVRALNAAGGGQRSFSEPLYPWPSSTWRPGIEMGPSREYAFFAGNTIFAVTSPAPFAAPLDAAGLPWTTIGRGRYAGTQPPHHDNEAAAVLPLSDTVTCLVLTGGREYRDLPATTAVSTECARDDGFEGQSVATPPPEPLPAARFDHASVAVGNRIYVLGGSRPDGAGVDVPLSDVSFATFGADLSVTGWRSTTPLPAPAATVTAATADGRLYAIAPSFAPDRILCADVTADGSLSPWREAGRMPYSRARPSAIIVHGFFYVLGGSVEPEPTVLIGRVDSATGAVDSWVADPADSFARHLANPAVLFRNDRMYVFGSSGFVGGSPLQTAEIDPATGRPKPWR